MLDKSLQMMEDTYGDYLAKDISRVEFCKRLSTIMGALPLDNGKKHFDVNIVNDRGTENFFGMRIFATINEFDKFVESTAERRISFNTLLDKWKEIPNWYMEIDANIFDRNMINLTPKELTAMTIHEIGHVIYSSKPVERYYRAYREANAKLRSTERPTTKVLYTLYTIPLALACMQRDWVNGKNEINVEYFADNYLKDFGYADAMVSALNKIIRASGSINTSEVQKEHEIAASVEWCNVNIIDLEKRQRNLKDELFQKSLRTSSPFFKTLCLKNLKTLGTKLRERYSGAVVEMTIQHLQPGMFVAYESYIDPLESADLLRRYNYFKKGAQMDVATETSSAKLKKMIPDEYDIDRIAIEIDRIDNHHDRVYVLDLIYRQEEKITNFEEIMDRSSDLKRKYSEKMKAMHRQLDDMRKTVLSKKSFNKDYKFFVKYPDGYEG